MTAVTETLLPSLATALLAAGIPVVVCKPNPAWVPGSTAADVLPPQGWATVTAEQAERDAEKYRPGIDTLAMVGGQGIDVMDVDTKVPGVEFTDLPDEVRVYGITISPSGGAHFPIPSTGYGKGSLEVNGKHIGDYVGGTKAGGSRMLAFLPGSARPKYAGLDYSEAKPWNITRLLNDEPSDLILDICKNSGNLSTTATAGNQSAAGFEVRAFLAEHADTVTCAYGDAALTAMQSGAPKTKRHEWYIAAVTRAVELMKAGCLDASAFDALTATLGRIKPEGGTSPFGCLAWAIGNTTGASECPTHDPVNTWLNDAADAPDPEAVAVEDAVFTATEQLAWLRDLARARMVSPWALLAACVTRAIACTGPAWRVPAFVGSPASLNFYTALIGSSNSGKTITSSVAAEALPSAVVDILNPSSGEGLVAMYTTQERGKPIQTRDRALSIIDEIATLGGQQARSGSTLGSVLRTAWSGAAMSNHAADPTRRRSVAAHTYRFAMVCGVQYDTADILMADEGAGTPQRFLWIPAADPAAVLDHPEPATPGPFERWAPPRFVGPNTDIAYPDHVRPMIREARLQAVKNTDSDRDALHGHMLLVRLKLAAGLAILHGTAEVDDTLWDVSGHILDLSTATLDIVLAHNRKQQTKEAAAKGHAAAIADEVKEERKLVQVARRLGAYAQRHYEVKKDTMTRNVLRKMLGRDRAWIDEALAKAIALGYVNENGRPHDQRPAETVTFYIPGKVRA